MTVTFDPDTASLQLDPEAFAAIRQLVQDGRGDRADQARLADLRESGVLRGDIPHPGLAYGLAAVADPVCWLQLRNRYRDERGWRAGGGDGWIGREVAALLLELPDGLREFLTMPVMFLPEAVARSLALGPRPRPPGAPLQVPSGSLEELCAPDPVRHERAAARFAEAAAPAGAEQRSAAQQLSAGIHRHWEATMRWHPGPGSTGERVLQVVDSEAGMWLVEPGDSQLTLWPATPAVVWQELVGLLPRDGELREGAHAR